MSEEEGNGVPAASASVVAADGDVLHGAVRGILAINAGDGGRCASRVTAVSWDPDGGVVVLLLGAQRAGGAQGHPPRVHQHDRRAPRQKQRRMNREHDIDGAKAVPSS
jgi:hypothetical protein